MNIAKSRSGESLTVAPEGRLDSVSAPELEAALADSLDGVTELVFDLGKMEYLSSAGLRVFLLAQKRMNRQGRMRVINPNETVSEIFELTGFSGILDIE